VRVPADAALPRLHVLLDPEAMAPLLERSLGRPARVDTVRIGRVSYKPGERVLVHYETVVDGRREDAVARAVAGRDQEARSRITWLPLDPGLPALASTPWHAARLLSYRPRRRAVVRMGDRVLKAYGSDTQFASATAGLRVGSALPGIATPPVEAVLEPLRVTVQTALDGERPRSLDAAHEAGALLRGLHEADLPLTGAWQRAQLGAARRKAALIGAVLPALSRRTETLASRLSRAEPAGGRLVSVHGDFHSGQLLRVAGTLYLLDLDSLCLASPALDLAEYAAEANGAGPELGAAVLDALVEGYGSRPDGLDWHLAAAILVRASHPFHRALPAWEERVETMVGAAEAVLR
jgi:Phosphotransferase enzyme family